MLFTFVPKENHIQKYQTATKVLYMPSVNILLFQVKFSSCTCPFRVENLITCTNKEKRWCMPEEIHTQPIMT